MYFSIKSSTVSERALLFGRFAGFVRLFWYEQYADEDKYAVAYWGNDKDRGNAKNSGGKLHQCNFVRHKISH
jgi:hypothetical protein